jgi:hypothetical protein
LDSYALIYDLKIDDEQFMKLSVPATYSVDEVSATTQYSAAQTTFIQTSPVSDHLLTTAPSFCLK